MLHEGVYNSRVSLKIYDQNVQFYCVDHTLHVAGAESSYMPIILYFVQHSFRHNFVFLTGNDCNDAMFKEGIQLVL